MTTECPICPRHCRLAEGQTGACRARTNIDGIITCNNYGKLSSIALDPIEKKPLRHFRPGSRILSIGSYGCNLDCPFCQNSSIAAAGEELSTKYAPPGQVVALAAGLREQGNIGVAYTYNEPVVGYEFLLDCARAVREAGMVNVLVTNGMICREPLLELLPYIDAMNIDLKGFSQEFYSMVGGDLETVKSTITLAAASCHVEVTTLIIPGLNDSDKHMRREAEWLASIDRRMPLHVSRFFPRHRMTDREATPPERVRHLRGVANEYLERVYTGNL